MRADHAIVDELPEGRSLQLLWLWVMLVVLYFAWEAAAYRGLYAILAEWEFDRVGQDLPTFNFTLLAVLLAWPALSLLSRRRSREVARADRDEIEEALGGGSEGAVAGAYLRRQRHGQMRLALLTARDYLHFLFAFASALLLAAAIALAWTVTLPTSTEHPRRYTPDSLANAPAREGAARFDGTLRYGRIASFSRGILFARRTSLYAPLFPPKGSDGRIRYFVEFLPAERPDIHSGALITHREGLLVRSDLPGALVRLYRYLGYRPADRYWVLYASPYTLRWPFYVVAGQFLLGGMIFFGCALWQRRHLRRLSREVSRQVSYDLRGMAAPQRPEPSWQNGWGW